MKPTETIMYRTIQQAAHLNNEAISLLAFGVPDAAFERFKEAVRILHNCAPSINQSYQPLTPEPMLSATPLKKSQQHESSSYNPTVGETHVASQPQHKVIKIFSVIIPILTEKKARNFIYNRVISFEVNPDSMNISFYCAVVMFNLAVTAQLVEGLVRDSTCSKALRLYDTTLLLLEETLRGSCSALESECTKLRVATLNNKSQIYSEMFQFDEHEKMLDRLFLDLRSINNVDGFFRQEDLEGFFLNILLKAMYPNAAAA